MDGTQERQRGEIGVDKVEGTMAYCIWFVDLTLHSDVIELAGLREATIPELDASNAAFATARLSGVASFCAPRELAVGNVVRTDRGDDVAIVAIDPDIIECAHLDEPHAPHLVRFRSELTYVAESVEAYRAAERDPGLVSGGGDISDEEAVAFNRTVSLVLLVDFLAWLSTRDEQVGPFSRHHIVDAAQASRVAAEFLTAQA